MGRNPFDKQPKSDTESAEQIAPPPGLDTPEGDADSTETSTPPERSHIEGIPTADWKPKPRQQDTRKRAQARKLSLFPKNKQAITKHANDLNVPEQELIRYLLEYGLEQVDTGQLTFEPKLSREGLTLYPHEKQARKTKTRSGYTNLTSTTCRGIPAETWARVKALAPSYPLWQVINKLIEHGLAQLANGQLQPKPVFSTQTLY